ncbi:MAG: transketolase [Candidatus Taylorbacteria bacterium CG11_big_fil_rev_8_21_14_0_20_46_11]|uniref:Transketolase n=1 Tax=Candidatus Taylorbacteria bacterium CG11_big_fil_rev_8_21_14_0_20_46_11 TaxID=1975025 RepID=A0A2H0KC84_9BACT|nr:MAG: transketolase [Candidatus Taylorbacteria bacterium CG11_big_fil_rev_8_21_14_0_20_46_11]
MINHSVKLNPKIWDKDVEQIPIRKGFGEGLLSAGEANEQVVGLCADLTESTQMHLFAKKFPNRFVEIGIGEQNLVTVASGMAAMGKIPFCSSYAMFSPGRNWEQIRTTICYNDRKVVIVGSHAGVSVGPDGGTHQAVEDIALMRVLPNMVVLSPCDSIEAKKATLATAKTKEPTYLRLAREKTPVITTTDTPFEIGKAQVFFKSKGEGQESKVGIIGTGSLLHRTLVAAKELDEEGVATAVLNLSTIKPLDEQAIIDLAKEYGRIVTVEEHQVMGGMGSALAECLAKNYPVPIEFIGVQDRFGQSGTPDEILAHYGMTTEDIKKAVHKVLKR